MLLKKVLVLFLFLLNGLLLLIKLLLKMASDPVCQIEKETKHLAKVVASYFCELAIHVWVVVKDLEQVIHL